MKSVTTNILLSACAAFVAMTNPCLAQPKTMVIFSSGTPCIGSPATPPLFAALSVSSKATSPTSAAVVTGPISFEDVAVTRNVDDCSVSLYGLLFQQQRIKSVTISFYNSVNGSEKETLRISLGNVLMTSIGDADNAGSAAQERVTLAFESITILDPVTGKSTTYLK